MVHIAQPNPTQPIVSLDGVDVTNRITNVCLQACLLLLSSFLLNYLQQQKRLIHFNFKIIVFFSFPSSPNERIRAERTKLYKSVSTSTFTSHLLALFSFHHGKKLYRRCIFWLAYISFGFLANGSMSFCLS